MTANQMADAAARRTPGRALKSCYVNSFRGLVRVKPS
jgi:hypothetical protein